MNYIITGGTGFIGTHLTNLILERYPDSKVWNLDIVKPGNPNPVVENYKPTFKVDPAWETVELGSVATLLNGRAYKQDELLHDGKYPVLRVGNFFSNRDWYYSDLELEPEKYCDNGDLLFAWSASFGPKIWDGGKVIYHYPIWKIILTDSIDRAFLYYI